MMRLPLSPAPMKTIPVLIVSAACFALPNLARRQALPFQQSPPPGAPVTATTEPQPPATTVSPSALPDGFAMKDGSVYIIKNGVPTRVTQEQVLRIAPNGMITGFDGQTWLIPTGQMMTMDGRAVALDPAIFTMEERARAAANVTGENRSGLAPSSTTGQRTIISPASSSADSSSSVPTTQSNRRGSSSNGSGSASTVLEGTGTTVIVDPRSGTSNSAASGQTNASGSGTTTNQRATTATPNQRTSSGTSIDPNATGASGSATPNQLNSRGTNTGPNARTTSPRPVTPNQLNSSGTNVDPNAKGTTSTGTGSTGTSGTSTGRTSGGSSSSVESGTR